MLDDYSASVAGINARGLTTLYGIPLTGSGIDIGQVEGGRPGKPDFDNAANSHPDVAPTGVYQRDQNAEANDYTGIENGHGTKVAGVMIANGAADKGIAPAASLFASAIHPQGTITSA